MHKTPHWHHLCQTRKDYFEAWERGNGPGQMAGGQSPGVGHAEQGSGLGDKVEKLLTSVGITEDRYKQIKQMFGLPPRCNCRQRKEWLNKVGRWFAGLGKDERG